MHSGLAGLFLLIRITVKLFLRFFFSKRYPPKCSPCRPELFLLVIDDLQLTIIRKFDISSLSPKPRSLRESGKIIVCKEMSS